MKKLTANYHTHTFRCHHATGTEREYIEKSISEGIKILGFSEHAPFNTDSYRMRLEDTGDYFDTLNYLKREYKNDIEIHIGFETEYYPLFDKEMMDIVHKYPTEYLILGQHYLFNGVNGMWVGMGYPDVKDLQNYVNNVVDALKLNRYTYLAHPDVFYFTGDKADYYTEMEKICVAAKETDTPLEFNMYGYRDNRIYPTPDFWDIAANIGNKCIIGLDAHSVEYAGLYKVDEAYEYLIKKGLEIADTVPLKKP